MRSPPDKGRQSDLVILLFLFSTFLLTPPFVTWWANGEHAWYFPYLIWLLVIALAAWLQVRGHRDDV
ncbi:MAG TPA: hypothetical protein VIX81_05895 [Gammaproteobacteria bacterium]